MKPSAWRVARLFAWLGAISFGGPLAHIALMQREIVERRGWLSRQEFLDLSGAMSLIPGPNSTELAMALGRHRAGARGLWAAGTAFIVPAFCLVLALAFAYERYGQLRLPRSILYGVQPVVIAIIVQAGARLLPSACKDWPTGAIAAAAFCLAAAGWVGELPILLAAVLIGLALGRLGSGASQALQVLEETQEPPQVLEEGAKERGGAAMMLALPGAGLGSGWWLFWPFLKIGSVLYGSGYVLLAFLREEFVPGHLSDATLLDAVAIGQVTPGPVFTTATFIGYLLGSWSGAVAATVGIFLPSFFLVGWLLRVLDRLRASSLARRFLDAVNAASLALMAAVALELGRAAIVDGLTAALALLSLAALARTSWNSAWLIGAGALAGIIKDMT